MILYAYQIGDLNLFDQLVGRDNNGVSMDLSRRWRTPSEDFTTVSGQKIFSPLTRSISEPGQIKLEGEIIQTDWLGVNEFVNQLKTLGGRQGVPLIAFRLEDSPNNGHPEIDWLVTYGTVTNINVTSKYASSEPGAASLECSISMILDTSWLRLSSWEWEYRPELTRIFNPSDPWSSPTTPDIRFAHPWKMGQFIPGAYFYRWKLAQSDDNASFWALKYSDGITGGKGADYNVPGLHEFYSDPRYWSADPKSIYAFTEMESDGLISLVVSRQTGAFYQEIVEEETTLDLSVLSSEMSFLGYGPLLTSDQIITGLVDPLPGYLIRDGEQIDVHPRWLYPGTYPGETSPGWNKVMVSGVDTPIKVAYLHEYGLF